MSIDNHLSEEQIAQCADAIIGGSYGELDSQLRNHLTICDDCAAEVLSVTDIAIDFKADAARGRLVRFKPWIVAASGVAAVGVIFLLATSILNQPQVHTEPASPRASLPLAEQVDTPIDTAGQTIDKVVIAAAEPKAKVKSEKSHNTKEEQNIPKEQSASIAGGGAYVPDQTLEILFENFTQAYRGEDVVINTRGVVNVPGSDSLVWSNPSKEELYVEFFDNTGNRFLTLTERSSGVKLPELSNGLYYWKLINQDFDLLFVGKIVVE